MLRIYASGPAAGILLWLVSALTVQFASAGPADERFSPSLYSVDGEVVIVGWDTQEGRERLSRSRYQTDYRQMAPYFRPQDNAFYCGIASSVIVLNSMRLSDGGASAPPVTGKEDQAGPAYTQQTLLNEWTEAVKPRAVIENRMAGTDMTGPGLMLVQLKGILEAHGAKVELHHAGMAPGNGIAAFRATLRRVLQESQQFILVNFHGRSIGAPTGGHISPLAAYDERSDSVLILDVAASLNPWYWAPVEHLYQAMHTLDGDDYRGYLVVSDSRAGARCGAWNTPRCP